MNTQKEERETTKLLRERVKILNIYVDSTTEEEVLNNIGQKLTSGHEAKPFYIVTPNPEIALQAQNDELLAEIINKADYSLPDGSGFRLANWKLNIIHGREMMNNLLGLANKKKLKVALIGGTPSGINKAASNIEKTYKDITVYADYGPKLDKYGDPVTKVDSKVNKDIVTRLNNFEPSLIFIGFGAPKQEKWIYKNINKINTKCLMTVGGAIDYWSEEAKLPPKWMADLELEWLWRLINDPEIRLIRIFKSVFVFPFKLFLGFVARNS